MKVHCPRCGSKYSWFDRLTQPAACKECYERYDLPDIQDAFTEEIEKLSVDSAATSEEKSYDLKLWRIARRNLFIGLSLFLAGVVLPVGTVLIAIQNPRVDLLVASSVLLFGGLERGLKGWSQLGALRRSKKYGQHTRGIEKHP